MSKLNHHAQVALNISKKRAVKEKMNFSTTALLKHAAGEVIEAMEAYDKYDIHKDEKHKDELAGELADVITCILIAAAYNRIDIEAALKQCQLKNYNRAKDQI